MVKPSIEAGAEIDRFTIGECVHRGGMATLWTVTHPGITVPLLMKIPRVSEGEDPAAIVSFEMEQMIVPRLAGPHVPGCFGSGSFDRQPYVVIERIPDPGGRLGLPLFLRPGRRSKSTSCVETWGVLGLLAAGARRF